VRNQKPQESVGGIWKKLIFNICHHLGKKCLLKFLIKILRLSINDTVQNISHVTSNSHVLEILSLHLSKVMGVVTGGGDCKYCSVLFRQKSPPFVWLRMSLKKVHFWSERFHVIFQRTFYVKWEWISFFFFYKICTFFYLFFYY
jgi:hypothetical protein